MADDLSRMGSVSLSGIGQHFHVQFFAKDGLLIACLAPAVMYVFIHGRTVHFIYLFVCFLILRVLQGISEVSKPRPPTMTQGMVKRRTTFHPQSRRANTGPTNMSRPVRTVSSKHITAVTPTTIISADEPRLKARRAILNKVSPEKLEELIEKLVETFRPSDSPISLSRELNEFIGLVFAAASRQPQYIRVFAELLGKVLKKVQTDESADEMLTKQAQISWASVCLSPVEKMKDWDNLTLDDQADARGRHRERQLAVAEFCGLLPSYELIPAAFPLTWLEALMSNALRSAIKSGTIVKESSTESAVEIIICSVRGLGPSETTGNFTDLDQSRFDALCDEVFELPIESSRVKCLIQDLLELRESGWSQVPKWKRALIPTKRASM
jgi:hypothetical protein